MCRVDSANTAHRLALGRITHKEYDYAKSNRRAWPHPGPGALVSAAAFSALLLTIIPWFWPLAYPLRLLTTLIHELGHGLAALLTGGRFVRFVVFADGSGLAFTAGGWRWLIIPAGYIGVALCATALIMLGRNVRSSHRTLLVLGAVIALCTLFFGVPTIFSAQMLAGLLTVFSGLLMGCLLVWAGLRAGQALAVYLVNLLAFYLGLSAFSDIATLVALSTDGRPQQTDAEAMAQVTFLPAALWAVAWGVLAALLLGSALWATWVRPWLRGR
ncbi:M50 family metallopeptidase [Candidatus Gracilibacteria bacterium]|nr:M50 family metallopeptidase [Candidatus Gracilibacteria bacterium]